MELRSAGFSALLKRLSQLIWWVRFSWMHCAFIQTSKNEKASDRLVLGNGETSCRSNRKPGQERSVAKSSNVAGVLQSVFQVRNLQWQPYCCWTCSLRPLLCWFSKWFVVIDWFGVHQMHVILGWVAWRRHVGRRSSFIIGGKTHVFSLALRRPSMSQNWRTSATHIQPSVAHRPSFPGLLLFRSMLLLSTSASSNGSVNSFIA